MIQQDSHQPRRSPNRFKVDYVIKDAYKFFVRKSGKVTTYTTYRAVCTAVNEYIMQKVLMSGNSFNLPFCLGNLVIMKKKLTPYIMEDGKLRVEHLPVDWKTTKELWASNPETKAAKRLVRYLNEHTAGYKCHFYWDKRSSTVANQTAYRFKESRANNRLLAKVLKDPNREVDFVLNS